MFAISLEEQAMSLSTLEKRLKTYGIGNVIQVDEGQSLDKFANAWELPPNEHVLLIGSGNKLSNLDVRRLTLNTVRLPRNLSVWDDASQEELVAARVPWAPIRRIWLEKPNGDLKVALRNLLPKLSCISYTLKDFTSGEATRVGGSFAKSGVMKYFRKTASGHGAIKLGNEMEFYRSAPPNVAAHYPELLFCKEHKGSVAFGIQYHDIPNMRDLLLNCQISAGDAAKSLRKVLEFEYKEAFAEHMQPTPSDYLHDYHFHRVWRRIHMSIELDSTFGQLSSAHWLVINGKRMPNIPAMLYALETSPLTPKMLVPEGVSKFVHADLHLENILVDQESGNFWLIDPRGYPVCDIYYDLGKLAHSYNGKYDLLHEGRHESSIAFREADSTAEIDFWFKCKSLVDTYDELHELMTETIHDVLGAKTAEQKIMVDLKTRFNEAMHFCSDMPFHIHKDATPNIAFPIYATGALLLAETLELMGIDPLECAKMNAAGLERLAEMGTQKWVFEA